MGGALEGIRGGRSGGCPAQGRGLALHISVHYMKVTSYVHPSPTTLCRGACVGPETTLVHAGVGWGMVASVVDTRF
jgi:hypothetical protein